MASILPSSMECVKENCYHASMQRAVKTSTIYKNIQKPSKTIPHCSLLPHNIYLTINTPNFWISRSNVSCRFFTNPWPLRPRSAKNPPRLTTLHHGSERIHRLGGTSGNWAAWFFRETSGGKACTDGSVHTPRILGKHGSIPKIHSLFGGTARG